jgi:hypothetical protein
LFALYGINGPFQELFHNGSRARSCLACETSDQAGSLSEWFERLSVRLVKNLILNCEFSTPLSWANPNSSRMKNFPWIAIYAKSLAADGPQPALLTVVVALKVHREQQEMASGSSQIVRIRLARSAQFEAKEPL